jgi:hypothetical protein
MSVSHVSHGRWLLLIHNIPPKPSYFRVKIWRHLQRLGAVAIKNSVYVLPQSDRHYESFQWVLREIVQKGGDASVCEAHFVEGLTEDRIESLFSSSRNADYAKVSDDIRKILKSFSSKSKQTDSHRKEIETELARLKHRLSEIASIDFFGATGRETAEKLITQTETRLKGHEKGATSASAPPLPMEDLQDRTWVTRQGIHVDRMASAWLIRRFIDAKAKFMFVNAKEYQPRPGEIRFDMFQGEFTHEGDRCTFEVLLERARLKDRALRPIAEIVHDIDLRDEKFGREDTQGIEQLIAGICLAHREDEQRLSRGSSLFDDLYEYFKRQGQGRSKGGLR